LSTLFSFLFAKSAWSRRTTYKTIRSHIRHHTHHTDLQRLNTPCLVWHTRFLILFLTVAIQQACLRLPRRSASSTRVVASRHRVSHVSHVGHESVALSVPHSSAALWSRAEDDLLVHAVAKYRFIFYTICSRLNQRCRDASAESVKAR
jgi:hypothetical protein